jgi:predicted nucleic acid-binding Zn ribbon protein
MKQNEQTLKEVLEEFIKTLHVSDKFDEVQIKESWGKIMGKMISKHTVNLFLKDKKLFITVDSAALRQELSYAKNKMIKLLNKEIGKPVVEDIVFR